MNRKELDEAEPKEFFTFPARVASLCFVSILPFLQGEGTLAIMVTGGFVVVISLASAGPAVRGKLGMILLIAATTAWVLSISSIVHWAQISLVLMTIVALSCILYTMPRARR